MDKLLLIGADGLGRQVSEVARTYFDCAFLDDSYSSYREICDVPLIGNISDAKNAVASYSHALVTIGNNELRETLTSELMEIGFEIPTIVFPNVYLSPFSSVGYGCVLMNNVTIQNGARVGNGVILSLGVEVHHDGTVGDYSLVYANSSIRSGAVVGKRVWVDSTITISNNSVISDDAKLFACSPTVISC